VDDGSTEIYPGERVRNPATVIVGQLRPGAGEGLKVHYILALRVTAAQTPNICSTTSSFRSEILLRLGIGRLSIFFTIFHHRLLFSCFRNFLFIWSLPRPYIYQTELRTVSKSTDDLLNWASYNT